MDEKELNHLVSVWNSEHPADKIKGSDVWKKLKLKLNKCYGKPQCIMGSLLTKPNAPKEWRINPEEWLSSDDIEHLESKFMKLFINYYFVGTFPIDFDKHDKLGTCLISSLCSLKLKDIKKEQIGIVFNTDVDSGPGEHWIALFCDLRTSLEYPRIVFFDSYGQKPEKEVANLMRRWKEQWDKEHDVKMQLTYNSTRHQYQDSECGMYCLYFHYCCLMGISMDSRIPDEVVRGLRSLLFRISKQ